MKELELEFEGKGAVKGFKFRQLNKTENTYLYESVSPEGVVYYEVFKRKVYKKNPPYVKEDMIGYPTGEAFGNWAWIYLDYDKAYHKLLIITRTQKQGKKDILN